MDRTRDFGAHLIYRLYHCVTPDYILLCNEMKRLNHYRKSETENLKIEKKNQKNSRMLL